MKIERPLCFRCFNLRCKRFHAEELQEEKWQEIFMETNGYITNAFKNGQVQTIRLVWCRVGRFPKQPYLYRKNGQVGQNIRGLGITECSDFTGEEVPIE